MSFLDRQLRRQRVVLGVALALFAGVLALRVVFSSSHEPILTLALIPVALVAWTFGLRAGLAAAALVLSAGFAVTEQWTDQVIDLTSFAIRIPAFVLPAAMIGWLADRDRSARSAAEEQARNFRFIAEQSSDTISTHTPDGDYTYVSGMCREMLGYEPEELLGTSPYEYFHPDDLELIQSRHSDALHTPEITTMRYRSRRKDGTYTWFESRMRTLRNGENGEIEELHCATHNLSENEQERAMTMDSERKSLARIDRVLSGHGLAIVYQPIIDLESGRTIGVEALSRFAAAPDRAPNLWFAEAWSVGLGLELELKAIECALEGARRLPKDWWIALNVSPETVRSAELLPRLGTEASRVIIEVTEHAEIADPIRFERAADFLREHGVRLAIDDAGSGFSGLRRLLDLNPDMLKLDLSLTRGIDQDPRRRALASALIAFGESANVDVVAEGIETEDELRTLRDLGVGFGQGYHLGRPAPAEALERASRSPLAGSPL
jgi:PAS domain S-box-containing protein